MPEKSPDQLSLAEAKADASATQVGEVEATWAKTEVTALADTSAAACEERRIKSQLVDTGRSQMAAI